MCILIIEHFDCSLAFDGSKIGFKFEYENLALKAFLLMLNKNAVSLAKLKDKCFLCHQ